MTPMLKPLPLSLYIHLPWCIQKCPYCDFNSHAIKSEGLPEAAYVTALLQDLDENQAKLKTSTPITSIFLGGGTPSLFSAQSIEALLQGVQQRLDLNPNLEVTLEANPGTLEQKRFKDYRSLGINRLSIGIQSLDKLQLKALGRIHDRETAIRAVKTAQDSGFDRINIDLMYGLPEQTPAQALLDLKQALALETSHLSWYQLTIEPNTAFYHTRPPLPTDDDLWDMQIAGQQLLLDHGFNPYEVSAYSHPKQECQHNLNYWQFGDYLGIGAGAHSKITDLKEKAITRHWQVKNPRDYLNPQKNKTAQTIIIPKQELAFEFMLNALRLTAGIPYRLFEERTGLSLSTIEPQLKLAKVKKLLLDDEILLKPTDLGKRFLNDLISLFLPE